MTSRFGDSPGGQLLNRLYQYVTPDPGYEHANVLPIKYDPQGKPHWGLPEAVMGPARDVLDTLNSPYTGELPEGFVPKVAMGALGGEASPDTLGIFAGVRAKHAPLSQLRTFELQRAKGLKTPGEMWTSTGWNRDVAGNPFFEINDRGATYEPGGALTSIAQKNAKDVERVRGYGPRTPFEQPPYTAAWRQAREQGFTTRIGDVMKHPQLYRNYPELADMPLHVKGTADESYKYGGHYTPEMFKRWNVPEAGSMTISGNQFGRLDSGRSVMLHELQHAVQEKERFPPGAAPEHVTKLVNQALPYADALRFRQEVDEVMNDPMTPPRYRNPSAAMEFVNQRRIERGVDPVEPGIQSMAMAYDPKDLERAGAFARYAGFNEHERYLRVAGETQARNVQTRRNWSPEQRRATPPQYSQDRQYSDQIVLDPNYQPGVAAQKAEGGATNSFFDLSNLEDVPDVPQEPMQRYVPPRGISQRLQDLLGDKGVQKRLQGIVEKGVTMGGQRWYNAEPLRKAFVNELGDTEGNAAFGRYMDYVAATSPRSKVGENIRNASFYYGLERQGAPMPDIGTRNPAPYGHMAQRLHQQNAQTVAGEGWDVIKNPKPPTFATNLKGNQMPVTVDAHATKLPAMLSQDPRWLDTSVREARGDEFVNVKPRAMHEAGEYPIEEALKRPAHWVGQPEKNEYGALEGMYQRIAEKAGITPAQAQASAWIAGGKTTGLGSDSTKAFMDFFEERLLKTAQERGITPQQALKEMIRGERPLLSTPAVPGPGISSTPGETNRLLQLMGNQS